MLFTITLGLAAIIRIVISDVSMREAAKERLRNGPKRVWLVHGLLTLFLNGLPLTAFLFLALAVVAYVPIVGWVTFGITAFFVVIAVVLWWYMDG